MDCGFTHGDGDCCTLFKRTHPSHRQVSDFFSSIVADVPVPLTVITVRYPLATKKTQFECVGQWRTVFSWLRCTACFSHAKAIGNRSAIIAAGEQGRVSEVRTWRRRCRW